VHRQDHGYQVPEKAFMTLRNIVTVAMSINMFLLAPSCSRSSTPDSAHVARPGTCSSGSTGARAGGVDLDGDRAQLCRAGDPVHPGEPEPRGFLLARA
jgi:hypothetical protein